MPLSEQEQDEMRRAIIKRAKGYPDLPALVAAGKLIKKKGGYEPTDEETFNLVVNYATSIEVNQKTGKALLKISPQSKALANLAKSH